MNAVRKRNIAPHFRYTAAGASWLANSNITTNHWLMDNLYIVLIGLVLFWVFDYNSYSFFSYMTS